MLTLSSISIISVATNCSKNSNNLDKKDMNSQIATPQYAKTSFEIIDFLALNKAIELEKTQRDRGYFFVYLDNTKKLLFKKNGKTALFKIDNSPKELNGLGNDGKILKGVKVFYRDYINEKKPEENVKNENESVTIQYIDEDKIKTFKLSTKLKTNQLEKNDEIINSVSNKNNFKTKPIIQEDDELKIAHWNILNFGNVSSLQNKFKIEVIAKIISNVDPDVIGLTEINYKSGESVIKIVDSLNKFSTHRNYKFLYQPVSEANPNVSEATKEQVAIIYDDNKVEPEAFENGKIGDSYLEGQLDDNNQIDYDYVRPPYGVLFKVKQSQRFFTTIFDHFDSPGKKKGSEEISFVDANKHLNLKELPKSIGSIEGYEAYTLSEVFDYYNKIGGQNIVFGGDTNIPKNSEIIFKEILENGYKSGWKDTFKNSTSLKSPEKIKQSYQSTNFENIYSEPYDRMFFDNYSFKQNPNNYDHFKFDIYKEYYNNIDFRNFVKQTYKNILNENLNEGQNIDKNSNSIWYVLRYMVSDHLLVYLDLKLK